MFKSTIKTSIYFTVACCTLCSIASFGQNVETKQDGGGLENRLSFDVAYDESGDTTENQVERWVVDSTETPSHTPDTTDGADNPTIIADDSQAPSYTFEEFWKEHTESSFGSSTSISIAGINIDGDSKESYNFFGLPSKRYRGNLGFFEFGFNNFTNVDYSSYEASEQDFLDLWNGKSFYYSFGLMRASMALSKSHLFGLSTGLTLAFRDFVFENDITIAKRDGMIHPVVLASNTKKSKFTTASLILPLTFEFNFLSKAFISAGPYGEFVMRTHTKHKPPKTKNISSLYINSMQWGLTGRVGFEHFYVFYNQSLSELFRTNRGPITSVFTIGMGLWKTGGS